LTSATGTTISAREVDRRFAVTHPIHPKADTSMANTKSAKKATRQIARRTAINKGRRSRMRTALRKVEEAISAGDRSAAVAAMAAAEPALIRAAQKGIVHRNAARRKVSRLTHSIARLGKDAAVPGQK
jgi:small subunit ribosomal protein S20